jgi:peptide/nickel transport system substrate-binding protein
LFIVPDYWTSADEKAALTFLNLDMIGSGPFKMVEYQPGALIRLEAVKDHFYYKPKVEGIEIIIYKTPSEMVQALASGEVDMISSVPFAAVAALQQMPNVQIVDVNLRHTFRILSLIKSPVDCPVEKGWVCTGHPALRDRIVRVALAYAVDKQRIIDDVMLGLATPGLTLVPKGLGKFYNSGIFEYTYDVDQANAFLDAAKYLDTNGDGVREMPDGSRDLEFRLGWPTNIPTAEHEAQLQIHVVADRRGGN